MAEKNITYKFGINPKQDEFHDLVINAALNKNDYRYLFYGGAIRGGKTYCTLLILILLAKYFPKSRWYVIRENSSQLVDTTIPSFEKLCPLNSSLVKKYNRDKSNFYVEFENGSKIFFANENIANDPDLDWMKGLECNGFLLEQIEGLSQKTFQKAIERAGSWYIDPMPSPLVLATLNPTHTWVKEQIYEKHRRNELKPPYYFLEALPNDNPMVTNEQWEGWKSLDPIQYARYIKGDWDVIESGNVFMTQYTIEKHESIMAEFSPSKQLRISIDFNINPFCVIFSHIWQDDKGTHCYIFDEMEIVNGSIQKMIEQIKSRYQNQLSNCIITGDAMGKKRSIEQIDNASNYTQLQRGLNLKDSQFQLPANPTHENSRADCNYILYNFTDLKINPKTCPNTCRDMKIVQCDIYGSIVKSNRSKTEQKSDYLDCVRYLFNTFLHDWKEKHQRNYVGKNYNAEIISKRMSELQKNIVNLQRN